MYKSILGISFLACLLLSSAFTIAQNDKDIAIANQYFQNGSFEKAAELYEKLMKDYPDNTAFYNNLFQSYLYLKNYGEAEKLVKKQAKKEKDNPKYQVDLGYIYAQAGQSEKAKETYELAIAELSANDMKIRLLASAFTAYREDDYVIQTYEKGNSLLNDPTKYSYELGNAYRMKGDAPRMVENYLNFLEKNPSRDQQIKNLLQSASDKKAVYQALEKQLYGKIQKVKEVDNLVFTEMLIWLFIQQKDFESALIQSKALDKRLGEDGNRILELARLAITEKAFDDAIVAYTYLLESNRTNNIQQLAKTELLNCRKQKVEFQKPPLLSDLQILEKEYEQFLQQYSKNLSTVKTMHELAELKAYYLNNLDGAIALMNEIVEMPGLNNNIKNRYKLDLGDYYVMQGEVWEATLIFFQVDKAERDSPTGELARFKNAQLSYYKGEFEWCQAQLKVLKGSTTELIANDALELSVFITDNLGLDTSSDAMIHYANAALLQLQHLDVASMQELDYILNKYPGHALTDDALFVKAKIEAENGRYKEASVFLESILNDHKEDLLGDNAAFMLAEIYEFQLVDLNRAMDLYKQILLDYKDSVFTVEARKRYRMLRGDNL